MNEGKKNENNTAYMKNPLGHMLRTHHQPIL